MYRPELSYINSFYLHRNFLFKHTVADNSKTKARLLPEIENRYLTITYFLLTEFSAHEMTKITNQFSDIDE